MLARNYPPLHETILNFLHLLSSEANDNANDLKKLSIFLDDLSLIYHSTNDIEAETLKDPQRPDYKNTRNMVLKHFPNLGLYNVPEKITRELGQTEIIIGDAIDDITDIVCDLSEVAWCLDNATINDALWHFRFGYEHHWGNHLRQLQLYLYSLLYEG